MDGTEDQGFVFEYVQRLSGMVPGRSEDGSQDADRRTPPATPPRPVGAAAAPRATVPGGARLGAADWQRRAVAAESKLEELREQMREAGGVPEDGEAAAAQAARTSQDRMRRLDTDTSRASSRSGTADARERSQRHHVERTERALNEQKEICKDLRKQLASERAAARSLTMSGSPGEIEFAPFREEMVRLYRDLADERTRREVAEQQTRAAEDQLREQVPDPTAFGLLWKVQQHLERQAAEHSDRKETDELLASLRKLVSASKSSEKSAQNEAAPFEAIALRKRLAACCDELAEREVECAELRSVLAEQRELASVRALEVEAARRDIESFRSEARRQFDDLQANLAESMTRSEQGHRAEIEGMRKRCGDDLQRLRAQADSEAAARRKAEKESQESLDELRSQLDYTRDEAERLRADNERMQRTLSEALDKMEAAIDQAAEDRKEFEAEKGRLSSALDTAEQAIRDAAVRETEAAALQQSTSDQREAQQQRADRAEADVREAKTEHDRLVAEATAARAKQEAHLRKVEDAAAADKAAAQAKLSETEGRLSSTVARAEQAEGRTKQVQADLEQQRAAAAKERQDAAAALARVKDAAAKAQQSAAEELKAVRGDLATERKRVESTQHSLEAERRESSRLNTALAKEQKQHVETVGQLREEAREQLAEERRQREQAEELADSQHRLAEETRLGLEDDVRAEQRRREEELEQAEEAHRERVTHLEERWAEERESGAKAQETERKLHAEEVECLRKVSQRERDENAQTQMGLRKQLSQLVGEMEVMRKSMTVMAGEHRSKDAAVRTASALAEKRMAVARDWMDATATAEEKTADLERQLRAERNQTAQLQEECAKIPLLEHGKAEALRKAAKLSADLQTSTEAADRSQKELTATGAKLEEESRQLAARTARVQQLEKLMEQRRAEQEKAAAAAAAEQQKLEAQLKKERAAADESETALKRELQDTAVGRAKESERAVRAEAQTEELRRKMTDLERAHGQQRDELEDAREDAEKAKVSSARALQEAAAKLAEQTRRAETAEQRAAQEEAGKKRAADEAAAERLQREQQLSDARKAASAQKTASDKALSEERERTAAARSESEAKTKETERLGLALSAEKTRAGEAEKLLAAARQQVQAVDGALRAKVEELAAEKQQALRAKAAAEDLHKQLVTDAEGAAKTHGEQCAAYEAELQRQWSLNTVLRKQASTRAAMLDGMDCPELTEAATMKRAQVLDDEITHTVQRVAVAEQRIRESEADLRRTRSSIERCYESAAGLRKVIESPPSDARKQGPAHISWAEETALVTRRAAEQLKMEKERIGELQQQLVVATEAAAKAVAAAKSLEETAGQVPSLTKRAAAAESDAAKAAADLKRLRLEQERVVKEKQQAESSLRTATAESERQREDIAAMDAQIEDAQRRVRESEVRLRALRKARAAESSMAAAVESEPAAAKHSASTVAKLSQALAHVDALLMQCKQDAEHIEELQDENGTLKRDLDDRQDAIEETSGQVDSLKRQLFDKDAQMDELEEVHNAVQAEKDAAQAEAEKVLEQVRGLRKETATLTDVNAQAVADRDRFEAVNAALVRRLADFGAELSDALAQVREESSANAQAEAALRAERQKTSQLEAAAEALQGRLHDMETQASGYYGALVTLRKHVAAGNPLSPVCKRLSYGDEDDAPDEEPRTPRREKLANEPADLKLARIEEVLEAAEAADTVLGSRAAGLRKSIAALVSQFETEKPSVDDVRRLLKEVVGEASGDDVVCTPAAAIITSPNPTTGRWTRGSAAPSTTVPDLADGDDETGHLMATRTPQKRSATSEDTPGSKVRRTATSRDVGDGAKLPPKVPGRLTQPPCLSTSLRYVGADLDWHGALSEKQQDLLDLAVRADVSNFVGQPAKCVSIRSHTGGSVVFNMLFRPGIDGTSSAALVSQYERAVGVPLPLTDAIVELLKGGDGAGEKSGAPDVSLRLAALEKSLADAEQHKHVAAQRLTELTKTLAAEKKQRAAAELQANRLIPIAADQRAAELEHRERCRKLQEDLNAALASATPKSQEMASLRRRCEELEKEKAEALGRVQELAAEAEAATKSATAERKTREVAGRRTDSDPAPPRPELDEGDVSDAGTEPQAAPAAKAAPPPARNWGAEQEAVDADAATVSGDYDDGFGGGCDDVSSEAGAGAAAAAVRGAPAATVKPKVEPWFFDYVYERDEYGVLQTREIVSWSKPPKRTRSVSVARMGVSASPAPRRGASSRTPMKRKRARAEQSVALPQDTSSCWDDGCAGSDDTLIPPLPLPAAARTPSADVGQRRRVSVSELRKYADFVSRGLAHIEEGLGDVRAEGPSDAWRRVHSLGTELTSISDERIRLMQLEAEAGPARSASRQGGAGASDAPAAAPQPRKRARKTTGARNRAA
eukprot:TRINITY_DN917_c0_g1_i6.p1 TRINITY_DN917_c0_g1~~TRINITY_DN917_c0_g1_i6.p1  ORF type:complete len:2400 (+),score=918.40 TRINITY_DN917_c0_g1_i6:85-7284(+)